MWTRAMPRENKNIGQVYQLLTLNAESDLNNLFDTLLATHPAKAPYSLFKQASDSVRSGVIIGLGSRLQVFQSEMIKKITARDEIDLELPGQSPALTSALPAIRTAPLISYRPCFCPLCSLSWCGLRIRTVKAAGFLFRFTF